MDGKVQSSAFDRDGNTITESSLSNCTINNSTVKRSALSDCVLSNVENASRITAQKSQFHNTVLVERSDITNSTIRTQSSVRRSTIGRSVIEDSSSVSRSTVGGTTLSRSELKRATLTNCAVTECNIDRSDFQGLVLKYGIWKRNVLIGRTGDQEPIVIRNYGPKAGQSASVLVGSTIPGLDPKDHAAQAVRPPSYHAGSYTSANDRGLDLPPPYEP
ncbi:unnamed protein product [Penicillium glandicola]